MAKPKGFTAKLVEGEGLGEIQSAIVYGDAAMTRGGQIARSIEDAKQSRMSAKGAKEGALAKFYFERTLLSLSDALSTGDAKTFREIADYLDARKWVEEHGPVAPVETHAMEFIEFCRQAGKWQWCASHVQRMDRFIACSRASKLLHAARQKSPFLPSVSELWQYLIAMSPAGNAPDRKTAERIAERLRIKPAPRKRGEKKDSNHPRHCLTL